ncbi:hypothetical protein BpHYR1_002955 [Brachionus plicatilis]|uniref:Uncharacterized protein n=1 Tax=Brachionus plicatilis TaxID=10195 RepID=A0A3M7R6V5_BRAPC|nr:hypothetical protein BpHYR1_002955 [Brachionus plicatilis]
MNNLKIKHKFNFYFIFCFNKKSRIGVITLFYLIKKDLIEIIILKQFVLNKKNSLIVPYYDKVTITHDNEPKKIEDSLKCLTNFGIIFEEGGFEILSIRFFANYF